MNSDAAKPNGEPASPTPAESGRPLRNVIAWRAKAPRTDHAAKAAERREAGMSIREHHQAIAQALNTLGHDTRAARLAELSRILGRPVGAFAELTDPDAVTVMNHLIRALEATRDGA